jgi:MtN3 and saliva related transmembrane protein
LDWKELIGFVGGFLTTMGMVPQVWRLFKLKSAHEISMTFTLSLNIGIALWLVYGILHGLMSVIIWNGIALVLCCGMLYAKMKWGR